MINKLKQILDENVYERKEKAEVKNAFHRLNVKASESLEQFYMNFAGPFWKETLGVELLDMVEDDVNVESMTMECRNIHKFPEQYLVLTQLCANEVMVWNSSNDKVYRVDFEGGDTKLLNGQLEPEWESFEDFINTYFDL